LDLGDDSFYQSRRDEIEERLNRMTKKGETLKMLREVDERERERGTMAIGVRWGYERGDLEEIVQVSAAAFWSSSLSRGANGIVG
jgi:fanconi-associated nuclease 1